MTSAIRELDEKYIRMSIDLMDRSGFVPYSVDGGEETEISVFDKESAVAAIMLYDDATVWFRDNRERETYIFFVLGNDGDDVVCDCGMTADAILELGNYYNAQENTND